MYLSLSPSPTLILFFNIIIGDSLAVEYPPPYLIFSVFYTMPTTPASVEMMRNTSEYLGIPRNTLQKLGGIPSQRWAEYLEIVDIFCGPPANC